MADYAAQLLPSLLFSLTVNNFASKWGAAAVILVGVTIVTYLTVTGHTLRALFPSLGSRRPRSRQPNHPHHDDHGQGRGIPRSYPGSFAPRTFVIRTNGPWIPSERSPRECEQL